VQPKFGLQKLSEGREKSNPDIVDEIKMTKIAIITEYLINSL